MAEAKVDLLALDVDGTLVPLDQIIQPDVLDAIEAASEAGVRIVLATGRNATEALPVWHQLRLSGETRPEGLVTNGGAIVSDPITGQTLYHKPLPRDLANEIATLFLDAGHSAIGNIDRWRWGRDLQIIEGADSALVYERWFRAMADLRFEAVENFGTNGDATPDVLRLNAVFPLGTGREVEDQIRATYGDRVVTHCIKAPNYGIMLVEVFHPQASKWTALQYIAQGHRIGAGRMAAVGDDRNDIPMLRGAKIGCAMAEAEAEVQQAADVVATEGLAAFIRSLL